MTSRITIRRHTTESGKHGYRWECHDCRVGGTHQFERWTDYKATRPQIHPWRRCIDAVDLHVCTAHRGLVDLAAVDPRGVTWVAPYRVETTHRPAREVAS